jgi:dihydrofolate synthase / folylpolyglutamate synthase
VQAISIKTHKITEKDTDLMVVLDAYLPHLEEGSIVAVTSKIVSIIEGSIVKMEEADKEALVEKEADLYLPRGSNKYDVCVSVKNGIFIASGGIDESNGNGYYILWPRDPQASANAIREHLVEKYNLKNIGVIITDSRLSPLRWGVTGVAIAHSGFAYLNSYVGKPDIFGRPMHVEKVNVPDTLAATAVGIMGEGDEQTPLGVITGATFVQFQDQNPSEEELAKLHIAMEDDIYAGMLTSTKWEKSKRV